MPQEFDLSRFDNEGIEGAIRRHQEQGATDRPLYHALLAERSRRNSKYLNIEKTIELLIQTARQKTYTTYKQVTEANGIDFSKVRYQAGKHLDEIIDLCHSRGWPLLSALCVKQNEVNSGDLSGDSLKGFVAGVRRHNIPVTDAHEVLKSTQTACFVWAEKN
jgi:hypothetical protein